MLGLQQKVSASSALRLMVKFAKPGFRVQQALMAMIKTGQAW